MIGAILTACQAVALGHGASPARAFLDGYSAGLLTAAALMLLGATLTLRTLNHRRAASQPQPTPAQPAPAHASRPEPVG